MSSWGLNSRKSRKWFYNQTHIKIRTSSHVTCDGFSSPYVSHSGAKVLGKTIWWVPLGIYAKSVQQEEEESGRKSATRDNLSFHGGEQASTAIPSKAECNGFRPPQERTWHPAKRQKGALGSQRWTNTYSDFALKELTVIYCSITGDRCIKVSGPMAMLMQRGLQGLPGGCPMGL